MSVYLTGAVGRKRKYSGISPIYRPYIARIILRCPQNNFSTIEQDMNLGVKVCMWWWLCVCGRGGRGRGAEVMCLGVLGDGVSFSSLLYRVRLVLCTSRSGQI